MRDFLRFLVRLNAPCRDMTHLISRSLDEELPWHERLAYRLHVLYCTSCRRFGRQLRALRDAFRAAEQRWLTDDTAKAPRLPAAARERIASHLPHKH